MNEIIYFLKEDIRGLIIIATVSSIIAALFYDFSKKLINRFGHFWKKNKTRKLLTKILTDYSDGYTAGYANISSYQQIVLTGNYIIKFIIHIGLILFSTIIFVASLILIGQPFSWIITIFFSIILTFQYRKLKDYKGFYENFMELVFGEDFYNLLEKRTKEHLQSELTNIASEKKTDSNQK